MLHSTPSVKEKAIAIPIIKSVPVLIRVALFLSMTLFWALTSSAQGVFITEIADPNDDFNGRYVELYNSGPALVNLAGWNLGVQSNANLTPPNLTALTGTIAPGEFYLIANQTNFNNLYGFNPSQNSTISANGDDRIYLFSDAGITLVDIYGVPDVDGTNQCQEYEDGRAERVATVTMGNPAWAAAEWNINSDDISPACTENSGTTANVADMDPGVWIGAPSAPALVINEIHADPDATNGDANGDGIVSTSQDEFIELVNNGSSDLDISDWTLSDLIGVRHTFPSGSVISANCAIVVFGGGTPTGDFGNTLVQTSSTGLLGFNNGGDAITINDGIADIVSYTYSSEGGNNQSLTRDPDITGIDPLVHHSTATGSGGALYSPGTQIDGSNFSGCAPPPPPAAHPLVINEIHADPDATNGDANGDGIVSTTQDEFFELVNNGATSLDISGWTMSDGALLRHVFPLGSDIPAGCAIVVFSGGSPTGVFGNTLVQTASTGSLGLNNGGDVVTINDGVSDVVSYSYAGEGGNNQSITRDPDIIGADLVHHSTTTGSAGALFSPGTRIDGTNFSGCLPPPHALTINEIHSDPAGDITGDANGDGVRHATDDEFVELVNNGPSDLDVSGWTLSDGFSVRHTFPGGSVISANCALVVFGGATPTGDFGYASVQTASTGGLGLNNGGDVITINDGVDDIVSYTYGSEAGDNQSITRDPDITSTDPLVKHSTATGSGGALFSPGTRIDGTNFSGCMPPPHALTINEIHSDPAGDITGDANGDGVRHATDDEFVELVNNGSSDLDVSGWTLSDGFSVRHTFPGGSVISANCALVVFGGATPTGDFGYASVQTASTGGLGLNNSGDVITIIDDVNDTIVSYTYGSEAGDNQSITRDPDITSTDPLVKHSTATGSGGALFSPGTRIDGTNFSGCMPPPHALTINEIHADPDATNGDANGDGIVSTSQDEFIELVNNGSSDLDISGWTLSDLVTIRHEFPVGSVIPANCGIVVFGGGTPTGYFGFTVVQTSSTGLLGFNNGGDVITIMDGATEIVSASYGSEGGDNQSLTRDPDITGSFVKHTTATASAGTLFSPGTRIDGTNFSGCEPPPCGIAVDMVATSCYSAVPGPGDTYELSISYLGQDAGTSVVYAGTGSVGGDDPALIPNGTIVISGIAEGEAYNVAFSGPSCTSLVVSGTAPEAAPEAPLSGGDQLECEQTPVQTLTATAIASAGSSIVWYDASTGGNVVVDPSLSIVGMITYYAVNHDNITDCESTSRTAVSLTINAATTVTVSTSCLDEFTFNVLVEVTDMGSALTVDITNNLTASSALGVTLGTHVLGPFNNNDVITVFVTHDAVNKCDLTITGITDHCPPANDACYEAAALTCGGTAFGDTEAAEFDDMGTCGDATNTAPGVWFSVSGTGEIFVASTDNAGTDYDTQLSVYETVDGQNCLAQLTCVDGNDDITAGINLRSQVAWTSVLGQDYLILVHGSGSATGHSELSLDCVEPLTLESTTGCQSSFVGYEPAEGPNYIQACADGGTQPYTFDWVQVSPPPAPSTILFTQSADGICADAVVQPTAEGCTIYSVVVTDANGIQMAEFIEVCLVDLDCANNPNSLKVQLCHNGITICVSENAALNHIAHGDSYGPCDNPCSESLPPIIPVTAGPSWTGGTSGTIEEASIEIYPNPTSGITNLQFTVPEAGNVELALYSMDGKKVDQIYNGNVEAGAMNVADFNAASLPSGVYLYQLISNNTVLSGRIQITR